VCFVCVFVCVCVPVFRFLAVLAACLTLDCCIVRLSAPVCRGVGVGLTVLCPTTTSVSEHPTKCWSSTCCASAFCRCFRCWCGVRAFAHLALVVVRRRSFFTVPGSTLLCAFVLWGVARPDVIHDDTVAMASTLALGLTNGFASVNCMLHGRAMVPPNVREEAGYILTLCMSIGITLGVLIALPLNYWIAGTPV